MKRFILLILLLVASCKTVEYVPVVQKDSVYVSTVEYDSIYIFNDRYIDRAADTIKIIDKQIEYRFRAKHDTIYKTKIDSIPYPIEICVYRDIKYIPKFYKRMTMLSIMTIIAFIIGIVCKYRKYIIKLFRGIHQP